jgi:hypothetical protein
MSNYLVVLVVYSDGYYLVLDRRNGTRTLVTHAELLSM